MTRTATLASGAFGAAVALLYPAALPAQLAPPPTEEQRRVLEQTKQQLAAAQATLASARARVARAEGKVELAVAEGRKVLRYHEGRLKVVRELSARGRICSAEPLQRAEGAVAVARAWLAEVEGRRDDLRAELPRVIVYYERRLRTYQTLLGHKAIPEKTAQEGLKEFREKLRRAREQLTALQMSSARGDRTGTGGRPEQRR
jgi:hypothetical protein